MFSIKHILDSVNVTTEYGAPCIVNVRTNDSDDPYVTMTITAPKVKVVGIVRTLGAVKATDSRFDASLYEIILEESVAAMPDEDF